MVRMNLPVPTFAWYCLHSYQGFFVPGMQEAASLWLIFKQAVAHNCIVARSWQWKITSNFSTWKKRDSLTKVTLKSTTMQKVLLVAALVIVGALQCAHGQSEYSFSLYAYRLMHAWFWSGLYIWTRHAPTWKCHLYFFTQLTRKIPTALLGYWDSSSRTDGLAFPLKENILNFWGRAECTWKRSKSLLQVGPEPRTFWTCS